jgi:hypothetical protein
MRHKADLVFTISSPFIRKTIVFRKCQKILIIKHRFGIQPLQNPRLCSSSTKNLNIFSALNFRQKIFDIEEHGS